MKYAVQGAEPGIWTLAIAACGVGALILLVRRIGGRQQAKNRIARARKRRDESLQRAEQTVRQYRDSHPSMDPSLILSLSLAELTEQLQEGSLSPEDVFYSYMEKALDVDKKLNCCTGVLLESLDQLKALDSSKKGLLYGVPVSIKENFGYKNHDSSCGLIKRLEQPAKADCVIVEVLKRQGAIPFVKTNIPQGLLNYDCSNPIYGQSLNPHNLQKTSGGSSGGEGGLIGRGGSILGVGTDIGGSIRIPSSFCGICGFKATSGRLSSRGISAGCSGQKSVLASPGPMAKDVDSLALCMQALLCDHMFSLDPTLPPLPFNMKLVPYSPPRIKYATIELMIKGILADGATTMLGNLKGGPVDPTLASQILPYCLPHVVKKFLSVLIKPLFPRISGTLYALCGVGSISNLWQQHNSVEEYIHETIEEWRRCNIDVLLCPMIGPAYNFFYCGKLTCVLSYTMLYNLLNFPAGAVPVSTVTAEDEEELKHYKGNYQDLWDKLFKQAVAGGEGLPVAVQCVALPWQDELCLRFMKEVEQVVKQKKK